MLKSNGVDDKKLSFFEADLSSDGNWKTAIEGCAYVLHVASPTHIGAEDEQEMTNYAVDGVLRVLKISRDSA
jgi:dihydroflavonol-4-reductase